MSEEGQPDAGEDDSLAQLAAAAGWTSLARPLQPVGIGRRGVAFLIDMVALSITAMVVAIGANAVALSARPAGSLDWLLPLCMVVLIAGHTAVEVAGCRTLGRLVTDSRAVGRDGRPASLRQRSLRTGLRNLPLLVAGTWALIGAVVAMLGDSALRRWVEGVATEWADRSASGTLLVVIVSGLCALAPPHRALHDQIAGMAVYDESDLARQRRTTDASSGGFDVIVKSN